MVFSDFQKDFKVYWDKAQGGDKETILNESEQKIADFYKNIQNQSPIDLKVSNLMIKAMLKDLKNKGGSIVFQKHEKKFNIELEKNTFETREKAIDYQKKRKLAEDYITHLAEKLEKENPDNQEAKEKSQILRKVLKKINPKAEVKEEALNNTDQEDTTPKGKIEDLGIETPSISQKTFKQK